MKKIILLIILILNFHLTVKADDITDFEIEGISVGDSLLDHLSEKEIIQNKRNYFKGKRKYYVVGIYENLKTYEMVDIYLKTDDKKYIIQTLGGMIEVSFEECMKQKEIIKKEFDQIFSNLKSKTFVSPHEYDKTGDSKQYQQVYFFGSGSKRDNHIRIECTKWSEKIKLEEGFTDGLNIVVMTTDILDWIYSNYE